jgi:hypothetical protein
MDLSAVAVYIPLGVLGLVRWASWLIRRVPAALYRPARTGHFEPLTIVVPSTRRTRASSARRSSPGWSTTSSRSSA